MKKVFFLLLLLVLLLSAVSSFADGEAKDISKGAVYKRDGKNSVTYRANDKDMCAGMELAAGEHLTVRSGGKDALGWLFLRYYGMPEAPFTVTEYASDRTTVLAERTVEPELLSQCLELGDGCYMVSICSEGTPISFAEVSVYSVGSLPDSVPVFEPSVDKTDILIITTHPDDEWLFLGAVYPIFCGEGGYTGTFAYITTPSYGRLHEALNGLYEGGVRTYPFFLGFKDIDRSAPAEQKAEFTEDQVILSLVRLYRKIRPLVVVTQDPVNGEYGHWQHIVGANAALKAAELAADVSFDSESAAEYGAWSVLKVYQHMLTENQIVLDCTNQLLANYGGVNALSVAKLAYKQHKSQQKYSFTPSVKAGNYGDLRLYGLAYSAVGEDTGNDMMENIPESMLAKNLADTSLIQAEAAEAAAESVAAPASAATAAPIPESTPEDTPEPTAEPTVEPTPEPTPAATAEPTAEPTPDIVPEETAVPTAEPTAEPIQTPAAVSDGDNTEDKTASIVSAAAGIFILGAVIYDIKSKENHA